MSRGSAREIRRRSVGGCVQCRYLRGQDSRPGQLTRQKQLKPDQALAALVRTTAKGSRDASLSHVPLRSENLARSDSRLAGKSKTRDSWVYLSMLSGQRREAETAASPNQVRSTMTNINPNCDGSHCRHGYKEVRQYPSASSTGSGNGDLYLCLPCFANENMHRHHRAKETGQSGGLATGQLGHCRGGLRQARRAVRRRGGGTAGDRQLSSKWR